MAEIGLSAVLVAVWGQGRQRKLGVVRDTKVSLRAYRTVQDEWFLFSARSHAAAWGVAFAVFGSGNKVPLKQGEMLRFHTQEHDR